MAQPQKERRLRRDKWPCQAKQRGPILVAGKILKSLHRDIAAEGDRNCKYNQENQLEALFSFQGRSNQTLLVVFAAKAPNPRPTGILGRNLRTRATLNKTTSRIDTCSETE